MSELRTSVVIDLAGNLQRRAQQYGRALTGFSERGQRDMSRLSAASTTAGRSLDMLAGRTTAIIAGAGAAYAASSQVIDSARLDKKLIQIQQTAGATAEQSAELRKELLAMQQQTGQSLDSLLSGFNNLVQAGLDWEKSLATVKAINPALAVTGSQAEVLSSAMTVAAEAFDFDLSKISTAIQLIDQMTKAGRLGNAELEDLSSIFARVGTNAKSAGLEFEQTLGLIEQLSLIERNPERLATLVDSTLRIFTNQNYMTTAQTTTGVRFYDAEGERRAALDVLDDIAAKFRQFKTTEQGNAALGSAFGQADQDTIKGLRILLSGGALQSARTMSSEIRDAGGTIARDLPGALENSIDQVGRLKGALRDAADEFAQPVNDAIESGIKYLLDEKQLSGKEILAGGAAGILGGALLMKGGGKLLQKAGGLGMGVAAGKALEQVAGVQPVYVVNMPGDGFGMGGLRPRLPGGRGGRSNLPRLPGPAGAVASGGAAGTLARAGAFIGTRVVPVAAAGAAGWEIGDKLINPMIEGTEIGHQIGRATAQLMAMLGSKTARDALDAEARSKAQLDIRVSDDRVRVTPTSDSMDLDVSGSSMLMP